jgi:hypothetical protein
MIASKVEIIVKRSVAIKQNVIVIYEKALN